MPETYPYNLGLEKYSTVLNLFPFSENPRLSADERQRVSYWMRSGLIWVYNFHHEEGIECFTRVLAIDPNQAMAHWGLSNCNGPNYNSPIMNIADFPSAIDAYKHAKEALRLAEMPHIRGFLSEVEVALIEALQTRFNPVLNPEDGQPVEQNTEAYAISLREVYDRYKDIPCVSCLYAEALMNFHPWKLWDLETGTPLERTSEIKIIIESALVSSPSHPGLNHFYIHLMEMSSTPEAALPSCAVLRTACPDAGHLVHMPSHIYVLLGMWDEAVKSNEEAYHADEIYVSKEGIVNSYTGYRIHNLHFICYAAMFAAQYSTAERAAMALQRTLPESLLADPYLGQFFEAFYSTAIHVKIRFGRWDAILAMPVPTDYKVWPYTIAMTRYGRGIALAILGDIPLALAELELFSAAQARVPDSYTLHNNTCVDMMKVAHAMLIGEIQYRIGNYPLAFAKLREAVALCDALHYDEPWGWMQPPRHALGALLLEQNMVEEAEATFRKDMDRSFYGRCHPDNIWALTGLMNCLKAKLECSESGLESIRAEIAQIQDKIDDINSRADVDVSHACLCAGMNGPELKKTKTCGCKK